MKKRIAFLVYDISLTGGAERVTINLSEELSKYYDVHIISIFDQKKFVSKDKYCYYCISQKLAKIPYNLLKFGKKIRNYLRDNNIDILFSVTAGVNTLALIATKRLKTKVVYCEHSNLENKTYGKKHELRQLLGAKYSDKIIALTERDRKNFIKKYKLSKDKVISISNWTNSKPVEEKYDIKSKKIVSVGRLEKVKGYDLLIKVAQNVYKAHSDWHWDIYGDGTYREKIENWIKENKLEDFITLKGNVNNLSKLNIYKNYSMYVMTSYYEGFSLTLLEAQSSKLPIVSFDSPTGPSELVLNNINGYIIPTYDTDKMAKKINKLIDDVSLRQKFSDNAHLKLNNFSKKNIIIEWKKLIDSL